MKVNIILFLVLLIVFVSCFNEKVVVVKYNGGQFTLGDLINNYKSMSNEEKNNLLKKEDVIKYLRKITLEKIILNEIREKNFSSNGEFEKQIRRIERETAFDYLRDRNVISKVKITEDDYKKYTKIYELYQIVFRTDYVEPKKIDELRKKLEQIRKNIKNLEDFKNMAKKYSEDVSAPNGGFLGEIRKGIMDDEIDKALDNLKIKTVSNIVETYAGLHLLWVENIKNVDVKELLDDRKLYETIYGNKVEEYENNWYENLYKGSGVIVNYDKINKKNINEVIVKYKDKILTNQDIFARVDELRQGGAFPEPTESELKNLVKNMAIKLVLDGLIDEILKNGILKTKIQNRIDYFLMNEYINRNKKSIEIKKEDIVKFYNDNKLSLFTFKLDNNKTVVQPLNEVEKFIIQKLESANDREARYEYYRQLMEKYNVVFDDKGIELFLNYSKKMYKK